MNQEQAAQLAEPFPDSQIHQLPKKNKNTGQTVYLDYVGHAEVTERLNQVDPGWWWEPMAVGPDGAPLIRSNDGVSELWIWMSVGGVRRPGVGTASATAYSGEVAKELISDAIRNAAMRFGVALHLWKRSGDTPASAPTAVSDSRPASSGVATAIAEKAAATPGGPITQGQSRNLYRLWHHKLDMSREEYTQAIFEACGQEGVTDDRNLSMRDAGRVIAFLMEKAGEEETPRASAPVSNEAPPPSDATFEGFDEEPF